MAFLRKRDYFSEIREPELDVILEDAKDADSKSSRSPTQIRQDIEEKIIRFVKTSIGHRYDVNEIFRDILTYATGTAFQVGDLVQYSESVYDPTITYTAGDLRSFSEQRVDILTDDIYSADGNISPAEEFDRTNWTKVTENNSLYYCVRPSTGNLPSAAFSYSVNAFTSNHDLVLGWDKAQSIFLRRIDKQLKIYYSSADRASDVDSIGIVDFNPVANIFPDIRPIVPGVDIENPLRGELLIHGLILDTTDWSVVPSNFFIKGDNRDLDIMSIVLNLIIARISKLGSPRNIPDHWLEAKDDAMSLLDKIRTGKVTPDLPVFFDESIGQEIVFGSTLKKEHDY